MSNDRNDISTEGSPGPEENDNLGAEDNKGEPPTVVPSRANDGPGDDASDTDDGDVLADDPDAD